MMSEKNASQIGASELETSASKLAAFSHVIFCNVPETFTAGADVECSYLISEHLEANSRDWIGLYKVGWRSSNDYFYYMWSPLPANYVAGKETFSRTTFPGNKMPKDDGEFYQFCYVNSSGNIRGASSPFQFKHSTHDDLIEIEDENGELLVIRTKTAVLEEQLKKCNQMHGELQEKIRLLENEKALLTFTVRDLELKYHKHKEKSSSLQIQLSETSEKLADLQQEAKDLQVHVRSLQEKVDVLNQEKQSIEKRLDDNDVYITSLQEKIKTLVTDKDALVGLTKILEEEKEQLKTHSTTSEGRLDHYINECDRLVARLSEADATEMMLRKQLVQLETDLNDQRVKCSKHMASSSVEKECLAGLQESLRNAEDKLEAAECCKKMLNEEVLAVKQAYEKLSSDLEAAEAEADTSKNVISQFVNDQSHTQQEIDDLKKIIAKQAQEIEAQAESIAEMRRPVDKETDKNATDSSAKFALESAMKVLKSRYTDIQKRFEELELDKTNQQSSFVLQLKVQESKHCKEVADLKCRLAMGTEEYKKIFCERNLLQAELQKLKSPGRQSVSPVRITSLSEKDLLRQMSEIQTQLDKRGEKANRYKRLYVECKKKYEALVSQTTKDVRLSPTIVSPPTIATGKQLQEATSKSHPDLSLTKQIAKSFDPLIASGHQTNLSPPLKPLPPPMQPQILPSAKVAAVKAQSGLYAGLSNEDQVFEPPNRNADQVLSVEEEKFVDAPTEPQQLGSDGNVAFSSSTDVINEIAFVDRNIFICPMCDERYSITSQTEFEYHVQSHFD